MPVDSVNQKILSMIWSRDEKHYRSRPYVVAKFMSSCRAVDSNDLLP